LLGTTEELARKARQLARYHGQFRHLELKGSVVNCDEQRLARKLVFFCSVWRKAGSKVREEEADRQA
jgi:hypothetical protein